MEYAKHSQGDIFSTAKKMIHAFILPKFARGTAHVDDNILVIFDENVHLTDVILFFPRIFLSPRRFISPPYVF